MELEPVDKKDKKKRKVQFRFSTADNIALLKEVMANNPLTAKHGTKEKTWDQVTAVFNNLLSANRPQVTSATLSNHMNELLKQHKDGNKAAKKASGTDETYNEQTQLLDDICDLIDDYNNEKAENKEKAEKALQEGKSIRDSAMQGLKRQKRSNGNGNGSSYDHDSDISTEMDSLNTGSSAKKPVRGLSAEVSAILEGQKNTMNLLTAQAAKDEDYKMKKASYMEADIALRQQDMNLKLKQQETQDKKDLKMLDILSKLSDKL
jgi:hypothetical protein